MRRLCLLLLATAAALASDPDPWRRLDREEGLPSDDVFDLCPGGPDALWAATAGGLVRIESHAIVRVPVPGVARLLAPAPDGAVYALYPSEILRIGARVEERIPLPVDPARFQADVMDTAPDGTLRLRISGRGWQRVAGTGWSEGPAPDPRGDVTFRGEVWRPTRGHGILRRRLTPYFQRVTLPQATRVNALALGRDGAIWCGTENGLARVAPDGAVTSIPELEGQRLGTVTACAVDGEGRLWIGSGSSFPGVWRLADGKAEHLDTIPGHVHRITRDAAGALWFAVLGGSAGEGGGAWCYSGGELHPVTSVALPSERVYDVVARDASGTLWFATLRGVAAYEGPDRVTQYTPATAGLPGEKVWCLCAARDGALWIGYQNAHGVSRLAGGTLTHFGVEDGLCDGNVWAIAEGREGVLWFANASGLSRYDGRRWSCFRNEEGLASEAIWPLLPLKDGSLWIGTLGAGLVHCVPGDHLPPRTRFRAERYPAPATVEWTGRDAWFDTPARDLRYRWRLDGGRWSAPTAETALALDPAPGPHLLEVQAIDRFGNVEDPPASVQVVAGGATDSFPLLPFLAGGALLLALGYVIGRRRGS